MEVSILLMQQIAQLFIVLLMGYVVVKAGLLKAADSKVLSVVFVYLVMPCVVLNAFQIDDTPQIRAGLLYSMGIAVGMHVVFLVLNAIFKRPLKLDVVEQVNIIYSNAAALVIPLVQALLGEEYVVYSCAFVIVQLILLWTHASACLQEGAKLEWKKILTNVNLIAIVAGALLYLLHISLPTPIVSTLSSVGAMIGPMGMLLAGMAIAEVPLKKVFCTPRNYLPVALRLIVVPIIVLLLLRVFHASDWIADGKAIVEQAAQIGGCFALEPVYTHTLGTLEALQKLKETVADPQHFHIIFDPVNVLTADTAAHQAEFWPGWCEVIGKDLACIHMKDALFVPNAPRIPTPLGEGQMDYTILRDWLHREHPDAALLRDEVILSAAQRDLNFIRAM